MKRKKSETEVEVEVVITEAKESTEVREYSETIEPGQEVRIEPPLEERKEGGEVEDEKGKSEKVKLQKLQLNTFQLMMGNRKGKEDTKNKKTTEDERKNKTRGKIKNGEFRSMDIWMKGQAGKKNFCYQKGYEKCNIPRKKMREMRSLVMIMRWRRLEKEEESRKESLVM